jgi:hypothetical protein
MLLLLLLLVLRLLLWLLLWMLLLLFMLLVLLAHQLACLRVLCQRCLKDLPEAQLQRLLPRCNFTNLNKGHEITLF